MENQEETKEWTRSLSENTHYIDVFFFQGSTVEKHQIQYYPEKEALSMFQRVVNKYKETKERILICLRAINHDLIKVELLNYPRSDSKKRKKG